jgi:putative CocE/NonD family hydrolase
VKDFCTRPLMCLALVAGLGLTNIVPSNTALADQAAESKAKFNAEFNDVPAEFKAVVAEKDFIKRVEMIPMRDGVKLYTEIFIPKGAKGAPILMNRSPYNIAARTKRQDAPTMLATLPLSDELVVKAGYIRVYQDSRGKYGSEGNYVLTMPVRGPLNPTQTDHSTDAYDTIEWLVNNLPESNGRVAMIGSSYEGFTTAMALLEPHPALKAAVPQGPLMDAWMGDDWFHYGAFRNLMLGFTLMQTGQRGAGSVTHSEILDRYEEFLRAGSTGDYIRSTGLDQLPWVQRTLEHPAYDAYWQGQAVDRLVVAKPSKVPTLWTQGLWDQEDMWGANHAWLGLKAAGHVANNWLVLGPWNHIQVNREGESLGPMKWSEDTALYYRREILMPFLNHYLKDGPAPDLARVTVYNTGDKRWERFDDWPKVCEQGCAGKSKPLYLAAGFSLSFDAPGGSAGGDTYTSDPAKPVPFLPRPVVDPFGDFAGTGALGNTYDPWSKWLVWDQRFVDGRPDVLTFESEVLTEAVHVQGIPVADIRAMTTGTDGDFVVKLIDVYPAMDPINLQHSGYQLPIAMDIFRGRYRESFEHPTAIPANQPQQYRFDLPNVNHVFQPGHRIMVQIQSTLFPLYDRNPQTFVPNIFNARPEDYRKADVTILRNKAQSSAIILPVVNPPHL